MKYSIATTVYNDEDEIIHFLDCLLAQTFLPTEIVIADGGSTDNTVQLIRHYAMTSIIPIRLLDGRLLNIGEGFNEAIKRTVNETVAIVAVGNWYPPNFMSILANEFSENISLDAVYSVIKGNKNTFFSKMYTKSFIGNGMYLKFPSNHGVLIKKNVIEELGYFYENFEYAGEDYEFFMHFIENGKKCKCVDTVSVTWDVPKSYREYCKQTRLYLIGRMQSYSNIAFLWNCRKTILYCGIIIALGICIPSNNSIWYIWLIGLILINLRWFLRSGVSGILLLNLDQMLKMYYLVREYKYLMNRHKICKGRLLR